MTERRLPAQNEIRNISFVGLLLIMSVFLIVYIPSIPSTTSDYTPTYTTTSPTYTPPDTSPTVYVTRTGECYHKAICKYGASWSGSRPVTLNWAIDHNYRCCRICYC